MTITEAFGNAPASTEKTALMADFTALLAEVQTSATAGAFTPQVQAVLEDAVVDLAEVFASEMTDHT